MRSLWLLVLWLPSLCCAQQSAGPPAASGTILGTVTDVTGALVPGATVILRTASDATGRKTLTDGDGDFEFDAVPAGSLHLAVTASGLDSASSDVTLLPGQALTLPAIALHIAMQDTAVEVTFTRQELGVAEVEAEEHQRILGFLPNFSVAYDWNAPPMTSRQKYTVALKASIDPVTIVLNAGLAGYQQAREEIPGYHEGATGYFKRFGADMATGAIGSFIGGAVLPQVFHQDPRYFWKGSGTVKSRIAYSVKTVFICRDDRTGRWMPNYSNVIGGFTAGAISNVYYPASSRQGVGLTFENGAFALGFGAIDNLFQEFLIHRLTPKLPRATPAPLSPAQP